MSANQIAPYRPKPISQRDGSPLANSNCRMASIATGLDYHTEGAETSTGAKMRSFTSDQDGGTDAGDAKESWAKGYKEALVIRDGNSFDTLLRDLRAGRMVHIDVWHAAAGGPCLSGSGAYGHTMAVLPDCLDNAWLVADPWCRPGHWQRVTEANLRAGAETWGRRVYGAARTGGDWPTGGRVRDARVLAIVSRVAREFMTLSYPTHVRVLPDESFETSGPVPVLYTVTKAIDTQGAASVAIQTYPDAVYPQVLTIPAGTSWYLDDSLTQRGGTFAAKSTVPYVGFPVGKVARAISVMTGVPYGGTASHQTVVYVSKNVGTPVDNPNPPSGGASEQELLEARQEGYDLALSAFPPRPK